MTSPTRQQLQMLKHKLVAQRKPLLRDACDELARWSEHPMGEIAGDAPDAGDDALATIVTDLDHSLLQRHVDEIRDIDSALTRMQERHYGTCIDCREDIALARLAAFPTAKRCIGCQRRREKVYATGAGATL